MIYTIIRIYKSVSNYVCANITYMSHSTSLVSLFAFVISVVSLELNLSASLSLFLQQLVIPFLHCCHYHSVVGLFANQNHHLADMYLDQYFCTPFSDGICSFYRSVLRVFWHRMNVVCLVEHHLATLAGLHLPFICIKTSSPTWSLGRDFVCTSQ